MSVDTYPAGRPAASSSNGHAEDGRPPAQVFLQPIASPSILGLFGFAGATFIVSAFLAGWYGNAATPLYLFPFAALFGGLAQFLAGMWSFRARDGLATAMHGMWGSFWLAYGLLYLLVAVGVLIVPAAGAFPALGYWFCVLAVITACGAAASLGESIGLFIVLAPLAVGSALMAGALLSGNAGLKQAAGYVLMASSFTATYTAAAMMLESTFGRTILPLGKYSKAANIPGRKITQPVQYEMGQPGVRQGQ